jgi:flagellar biosynthetic protein FliR
MLSALLQAELYAYMLVFARLGGAVMLLPGMGDAIIPARSKLLFALALTFVTAPFLATRLPPVPPGIAPLLLLFASELLVGIFLGAITRAIFNVLEFAGSLILTQIGLASATALNPLMADQGAAISIFLMMAGTVLVLQSDLHIIMLRGLVESYTLFNPASPWPIGDFTAAYVRTMGQALQIGIQVASPLLVAITVLYGGLALMARLMPQLQIFFIALPLQILLGFVVLVGTLPAMIKLVTDQVALTWQGFLLGGGLP